MAQVILSRGLAALGARAALMAVPSEDGLSLEIIHTIGYPPELMDRWRTFPVDSAYPLADAVRTGEPVFMEDLEDRRRRYPILPDRPDDHDHAVACVPMIVDGRPVGGLTFSFSQPRTFDADDQVFLSALARQSAQALERARLYQAEQAARAEAERARDQLAFLSEASRALATSLDYEKTLAKVAKLAVPRLADWCAIEMVDEGGSTKQLAVAHVDPAKVKLAKRLRRRQPVRPDDPTGVAAVIRTGRPELYPTIPEEMIEAVPDPKIREIARALELRSAMILPLTIGGRTLGAITLVWSESGRNYGAGDLELGEELARRAARAIENARLYRDRDTIARTLQQSLLPPELPEVPGMELSALYLPAGAGNEVGGDFYDVFDNGDGSWGLVIGDVCGKGPLAASVMGLARYTLRAAAMQERRPSRILAMLSEAVRTQTTDGRFLTVSYVRLRPNPKGGARLTVCCGGHPLPAVLRADGRVEAAGAPGTLLGLFEDPTLTDQTVDLAPGEALILYTDGITDVAPSAVIGKQGEPDLAELLQGAAGLDADGIVEHARREMARRVRGSLRDDMAILVARVAP
jgi:serine phosphatase RsbU (regulator of sigma subunit)